MENLVVIGAGIGGLTTALALKRAGIQCTVYEAAESITAVGAGIVIANNGMQVFRHLGVDEQICLRGFKIENIAITQPNLFTISSVNLSKFEEKYGLQNHAIHRADLHGIISRAVGLENIKLGKKITSISQRNNNSLLEFSDDSTIEANYVIGADGIKSKIRAQVFGENTFRYTKHICWRGVLNFFLPFDYHHKAVEAWGKGKRMGFVQINNKQVYWYLVLNKALQKDGTELVDYVGEFNELFRKLIIETPLQNIIQGPLYDLKPISKWSHKHICLVGDAAHATTPNMGQGACQAIEDAYVLGELAKKYSLEEAFKKYPEIRRAKAHHIVNTSWRLGIISQATNPIIIGARNFVLKYLTPQSVNRKQMDKIFTLDKIM